MTLDPRFFNVDTTSPPIVIHSHEWARLERMQALPLVLSQFSVLPFQHPGDTLLLENCIKMVRDLYRIQAEQTWETPELQRWWIGANPADEAERMVEMMRGGDGEAFAKYARDLTMQHPLPTFRVLD